MHLCCKMSGISYICVKPCFLLSLPPPNTAESPWIPFKYISNTHCDGDPEAIIAVFCFRSPGAHRSSAWLLENSQQLQSAAWGQTLLDLSLGSMPSGTCWTSVTLALPPPSPSACFWGSRHRGRLGMAGLLPSFPSCLLTLPCFLCTRYL